MFRDRHSRGKIPFLEGIIEAGAKHSIDVVIDSMIETVTAEPNYLEAFEKGQKIIKSKQYGPDAHLYLLSLLGTQIDSEYSPSLLIEKDFLQLYIKINNDWLGYGADRYNLPKDYAKDFLRTHMSTAVSLSLMNGSYSDVKSIMNNHADGKDMIELAELVCHHAKIVYGQAAEDYKTFMNEFLEVLDAQFKSNPELKNVHRLNIADSLVDVARQTQDPRYLQIAKTYTDINDLLKPESSRVLKKINFYINFPEEL